VGVIRDLTIAAGSGQLGAVQAAAAFVQVAASPIDAVDEHEMELAIARFGQASNGGLIVTASTFTTVHRARIISLAEKHRLPTVYPFRLFVPAGGLIAYGPDLIEPYRQAAGYVHRILSGEKAADLPVETPDRYGLALNLKTAKALGLTIPETLLATADEVIQ
jgi:putative ABC transport system substrate-binding protein